MKNRIISLILASLLALPVVLGQSPTVREVDTLAALAALASSSNVTVFVRRASTSNTPYDGTARLMSALPWDGRTTNENNIRSTFNANLMWITNAPLPIEMLSGGGNVFSVGTPVLPSIAQYLDTTGTNIGPVSFSPILSSYQSMFGWNMAHFGEKYILGTNASTQTFITDTNAQAIFNRMTSYPWKPALILQLPGIWTDPAYNVGLPNAQHFTWFGAGADKTTNWVTMSSAGGTNDTFRMSGNYHIWGMTGRRTVTGGSSDYVFHDDFQLNPNTYTNSTYTVNSLGDFVAIIDGANGISSLGFGMQGTYMPQISYLYNVTANGGTGRVINSHDQNGTPNFPSHLVLIGGSYTATSGNNEAILYSRLSDNTVPSYFYAYGVEATGFGTGAGIKVADGTSLGSSVAFIDDNVDATLDINPTNWLQRGNIIIPTPPPIFPTNQITQPITVGVAGTVYAENYERPRFAGLVRTNFYTGPGTNTYTGPTDYANLATIIDGGVGLVYNTGGDVVGLGETNPVARFHIENSPQTITGDNNQQRVIIIENDRNAYIMWAVTNTATEVGQVWTDNSRANIAKWVFNYASNYFTGFSESTGGYVFFKQQSFPSGFDVDSTATATFAREGNSRIVLWGRDGDTKSIYSRSPTNASRWGITLHSPNSGTLDLVADATTSLRIGANGITNIPNVVMNEDLSVLEDLTVAATTTLNGLVTMTNKLILSQGANQSLNAGDTIDDDLGITTRISSASGANVILTSTPQIEAFSVGSGMLILDGTSVLGTVTLTDERVSAGSGIRLVSGNTRLIGRDQPPAWFRWDSTLSVWKEIGPPEVGNVAGSGTTGRLPKFTASTTIGNSIVSESGQTLTLNGGASTIGNDTGNLTLQTGGGNGNINLTPHGTGKVGIGTSSPGKKLSVEVSAADDGIRLHKAGSTNALFSATMDGTVDRCEIFAFNGASPVFAVRGNPANASYINAGDFGVGTGSPTAKLHVLKTTEQLRLGYDASNYLPITVSSGGDATFAPTGGDTTFTGSIGVTIPGIGLTNIATGLVGNYWPGSNVTFTTNGTQITIDSTSAGVTGIGVSAADVLGVSGSDITGDDAGFNSIVGWDNADNKLIHYAPSSAFDVDTTTDAFDLAPGGVQLDRIVDVDIQTILGGEGSIGPPQSLYLSHGLTNSAGFHSVSLEAGTGITFATNVQTITISASASGVSGVAASAGDILSVSGSDLVGDDAGFNSIVGWDNSDNKLIHYAPSAAFDMDAATDAIDLAPNGVQLSKLATIANDTLIGSDGGGTPSALTVTSPIQISGGTLNLSAVNGNVITKSLNANPATSTAIFTVSLPTTGISGVLVKGTIVVSDTTPEYQAFTGSWFISAVNKSGTFSTDEDLIGQALAESCAVSCGIVPVGSFTDNGSNTYTWNLASGSLLPGTQTATFRYTIENFGGQTITVH